MYYEAFLLKRGIGNGADLLLGERKALNKADKFQVNKWLDDNLPTFEVWKDLRLSAIPEAERMKSNAYNVYIQFATKYDNRLYQRMQNGERPLLVIGAGTPEELYVKTKIWAVQGRPYHYVTKLLGMKSLSEAEPAYKYYKLYTRWLELLKP